MKTFIRKTTALATPFLVILTAINFYSDPANIFSVSTEKQMADIVKSGRFVTNISNFDHRLFQKELLTEASFKPDLIVIGSSRSMPVGSDYFSGYTLMNHSVNGASIEDIIAIYQMYIDNAAVPKKVVIGIDPWTFNENSNQDRWKTISEEYNRFKGIKSDAGFDYSKYKQLFSISYLKHSFSNLPARYNDENKPLATNNKYNQAVTKLSDGSSTYTASLREATAAEIKANAYSYISGEVYGIENFKEISKRQWSDFELLISNMKKNKIEITFFLSPYHPIVYKRIQSNYPMVLKSEEKIIEFAAHNNIHVLGSFNPDNLHMDESYFLDGMHCSEEGIKLIFKTGKHVTLL